MRQRRGAQPGRGAAWLGAVLVLLMVVVAAGIVLNGPIGSVLDWALGLVACTTLWWWTARLMVRGEVRWRALLPTAIVMGIGGWLYTLAAALWMPADVTSQYAQFGASGITQSFVTWFTGMAFLLILAAVLGPALADGNSPAGCDPGTPPPSKPTRHRPYPGRPDWSGYPTPSAAPTAVPVFC